MKTMRFIILLAAVAFAANERCDDLDGSAGGATDGVNNDAFVLGSCNNGQKLLASLAVACAGNPCVATDCCEDGAAGDDSTTLQGAQCPATGANIRDFDDDCETACTAGYENGDATTACTAKTASFADDNSAAHATADAITLTFGAASTTVTCNLGWANTDGATTTYTVDLADDGTASYTGGPCTAVACVDGADASPAKGHTCTNGSVDGTGTTCSCDCSAVWFTGALCADAIELPADANSDVTTATTKTDANAVTYTCSGTNLAALTSAGNGAGGAASYTVAAAIDGTLTYTLAGAAGAASGPVSCQAVVETFAWTAGDANSDVAADTQLVKDAATTVTCNTGYVVGTSTDTTYTVTATAADAFTLAPADAACTAKVIDVPAQDLANTNFATGHAAATVTFADAAGVAVTCNVGYFGADGKIVANAGGDGVDVTAPTCTQCTAADATGADANVVPAGWVVPENATGTAGTWGCTEIKKSGFSAWTCNADYEKNAAADGCVKKTTGGGGDDKETKATGKCEDKDGKKVADVTTKAKCEETDGNKWVEDKATGKCEDKDGKAVKDAKTKKDCEATDGNKWVEDKEDEESSAFMVGTLVAGIALLL